MASSQALHAGRIPALGRQPGGGRLQDKARLDQLTDRGPTQLEVPGGTPAELHRVHSPHYRTPARACLDVDEPVRLEDPECLAHRCAPAAVGLEHGRLGHEGLPLGHAPPGDVVEDLGGDGLGELHLAPARVEARTVGANGVHEHVYRDALAPSVMSGGLGAVRPPVECTA